MNPALSRRAAQAFRWPPIAGMGRERLALARRIERASSWADLGEPDRMLIRWAEANRGRLPSEVDGD